MGGSVQASPPEALTTEPRVKPISCAASQTLLMRTKPSGTVWAMIAPARIFPACSKQVEPTPPSLGRMTFLPQTGHFPGPYLLSAGAEMALFTTTWVAGAFTTGVLLSVIIITLL